MTILKRLAEYIHEHALFSPEDRILLAVSGGRDSVLMAHLLNEAGISFGIAHCNFNLRGEDSAADEQFASDLARDLGVPFFVSTFDTLAYAREHHVSVQMAARDLRYPWLEEIRADFNFQYIALAHHQNDTIETMLLNLTRGTGIAGMHGILPKNKLLIRPLLFLTREEIDQIVREKQYAYREDSSNASVKYARNKIRLEVIPVLKQLNPSLEETFDANRRRFAELEILLEDRLQELREQLFTQVHEDQFELSLAELQKLKPLSTLLYGLFHPYGFTEPVLHDLIRSWNGNPGKVFSSNSYTLYLDRGKLILKRKDSSTPPNIQISEVESLVKWNRSTFKAQQLATSEFSLKKEPGLAQLDFQLLQFPLTLRVWHEGDRFQPLGIRGSKKLSDFFIEQKIPLGRKKDIGVLENGNGDIIWVTGLRIDERYKITANTEKVFIFEEFI